MPVISSRSSLIFFKYLVVPLMWLALAVAFAIIGPTLAQDTLGFWLLIAVLLLAAVVSAILLWRIPHLAKPFADEVQDAGDALIVRKAGSETRIPLADIASMEPRFLRRGIMYSWFFAGGIMCYFLTLRAPYGLGGEVAFFPINDGTRTPWRSRRKSIYDDLAQRISQAHQQL